MRLTGSHPPFVGALIETRRKIKEWSLTTSPDLIDVINCRWSFVEFQGVVHARGAQRSMKTVL